jgi:hypothetical protein
VLRDLRACKEIREYRARLVSVLKVYKATKEILEQSAFKGLREFKVIKGPKVIKERLVFRATKVLLVSVLRVYKVTRETLEFKA